MIRVLFYLVCSVVLCFFAFFAAPNWLRSIYCMVFAFHILYGLHDEII